MLRSVFVMLSSLLFASQSQAAEVWKCSLAYPVSKHEVTIYVTEKTVWFENGSSSWTVLKNTPDLVIAYVLIDKSPGYFILQRSTGILTELMDAASQVARSYNPNEPPEVTNGTCSKG
jgi:hypothetical protein